MSSVLTLNENLALRMLARNGIAIIWQLNVAAATRIARGILNPRRRFSNWPMP
jgi:hypothetical protein